MTKSSTTPIVMLTLQNLRDVIREEMGSNVNVTHESETPSASEHILAKLAGNYTNISQIDGEPKQC